MILSISKISFGQNSCINLFNHTYLQKPDEIINVLHDANQHARGHLFNREIFEIRIFDEHLEKQMADSTSGLTPQDKKIVRLTRRIDKMTSELLGREKVPQKTIDAVAFKLRKLKLLVDKDYRKTLSVKQRLYLDQIHQTILSHSLTSYLKGTGVEVIPYWDWSGAFRSMGTIWRNVLMKWGLIEFGIVPKFKASSMSFGLAVYQAWYGLENDPKYAKHSSMKKPVFNVTGRMWHQTYVTGILSLLVYMGYYTYDKVQQDQAATLAAHAAAAEHVASIPEDLKNKYIKLKFETMQTNYLTKYGVKPDPEVLADMKYVAGELYAEAERQAIEDEIAEAEANSK